MEVDVRGKRVVVAGGSRGIGRSIALAFAEAGAAVSICARDPKALATTRAELAAFGGLQGLLQRRPLVGEQGVAGKATFPCGLENERRTAGHNGLRSPQIESALTLSRTDPNNL